MHGIQLANSFVQSRAHFFNPKNCKHMIVISQLFYGLFKKKEAPSVTLVQTSLEPVHEENAAEGCEFLDDFERLDEQPDNETK